MWEKRKYILKKSDAHSIIHGQQPQTFVMANLLSSCNRAIIAKGYASNLGLTYI